MNRTFRNIFSLLLAVVMILSLSVTAFAADSMITFKSLAKGFEVQPGSQYSATDLFDNFKNVMPGDQLTEIIRVKNAATDCDYIKLYMRAVAHDENAAMQDFLAQLTMRIYNGSKLIYESSPDQTGALANNVLLGILNSGEELTLTVELDVPIEMGNEYADSIGEVYWVFLAEAIEYEKLTVHKVWDDNDYSDRPDSVIVHLLRDDEIYEKVILSENNQWTYTWYDLDDKYYWSVEEEVPQGYDVTYKTEDNKVFILNHMDYEPDIPVTPPSEPEKLTVQKVWSDDNDKRGIRPDLVIVTLYNGDKAVDKVTLGAENNWTYTWNELDGDGDWSVIETGIPKDYTPSYTTKGDVVTITNTATLIQTGQLIWPIPVLGSLGALMIFFGIMTMRRKQKDVNV